MKKLVLALLVVCVVPVHAQDKTPATLRSILLEQLRTTHNTNDWFVSPSKAVEGLTAEQASWSDGKGNHSIGQLAYHLVFWNSRNLARFKGQTLPQFNGNNDETFDKFDEKTWAATVKQLDQVMTDIENFVASADDATVAKYASAIAHIGTHNAYHTGQIIYIRKANGWWDPAKGVK